MYLFVNFFANSNIDWLMNPHILHHKVPRASIISESKVSITVLCLLCSPHYTAVRNKNCSKSTSVIKVASMKNTMVPHTPVIVWNWSIHYPSLSAVFDSLHSSTNQELFEKHLCNKSSCYEKYGRFLVMQRKPSRATTKLTLFTVSKAQRRTLVIPWRIHCTYSNMPKGTSRAEATSNREKIKLVALAIIKLC